MRSITRLVVCIGVQVFGAEAALAQSWGVDLDCAETGSGYKGSAHGSLTTNARNADGAFVLRGSLDVSIRDWDDDARLETIDVEGKISKDGQLGELHVQSMSPLSISEVWFQPKENWGSEVRVRFSATPTDYRDYQMDCSSSQLRLPEIRNLVISRDLSYAIVPPAAPGSIYLNNVLFLKNDGNQPISVGPIRVRVAGREISGQLDPYATGDHDIPPDFTGIVALNFAPGGVVQRCQSYEVELDLDRERQSGPSAASDPAGAFDPFHDDSGMAPSPCLTWTTPIDFFTLGAPLQSSLISMVTLQQIVSSEVVARPDGKLCAECHFPTSARNYKPPAGLIWPTHEIVGKSWAQPGGWAEGFIAQDGSPGSGTTKPLFLRQAFQSWLDDGMR